MSLSLVDLTVIIAGMTYPVLSDVVLRRGMSIDVGEVAVSLDGRLFLVAHCFLREARAFRRVRIPSTSFRFLAR